MEEYPEEWRSPPVSLVALVGCPEQHALISTHLNSEQPPINALALPHLDNLILLLSSSSFSSSPSQSPQQSPRGILKREWLIKHRTKKPSVVALLFSSLHVAGDPALWNQLNSDLDFIKPLLNQSNTKLLLVLLLLPPLLSPDDAVLEDRLISLRKRAEVDSKFLFVFNPDAAAVQGFELKQSLNRLGSLFAELANAYYRDEGRRIKTRLEKKNICSPELIVRCCFKVAVYAEFRRDWVEALRFYEEAYHTLREMVGTSAGLPAIQRLVEIKTIAELLHFKISTLLLHGGKVVEAVTWFNKHNSSFRKLVGPPEAIFLHWEWMSRQFLVFAELMETSSASQNFPSLPLGAADKSLTEWEVHPAKYYQLAAHYLKEKRASFEIFVSLFENSIEIDSNAESVAPSAYVGQFARLVELGDEVTMQPIKDEEYIQYAVAERKRFQDSFEIIALLKKSYESFGNRQARRMGSLCAFQLAREYFTVGDFSNAKQLFDGIASLYRQEGWVALLWEVLGYLRECAKKQDMTKNFIEYSLEMAALPVSDDPDNVSFRFRDCGLTGPASLSFREIICKEVLGLVSKETESSSVEDNNLKIDSDNPLHLEIDFVSPLRMALLTSVAFHEQIMKPGVSNSITLSLLSHLPMTIEFDQLEVQFNQPECNFIIVNAQRPSLAVSSDQQGCRVENSPSLALVGNKWLRLTYEIKSEQSGKLECVSVTAKMGSSFTICCRAESPASMDDLPLWKFEAGAETFPTKDPALSFTGQKAAQVEEPDPLVDLHLGASGTALVGENFIIPVTVTSKGHEIHFGELKINLVDVRGGGLFSPRERESSSQDSHHVELIGISGLEGEDESQLGSNKIKQIQQSFGLVPVPFLKNGDSWSCELEIKWHRPKPVMLFISLGYSLDSDEATAQKVHVHKRLQIEGKTAVSINHHIMLPFRHDPLLVSRINSVANSDKLESLPVKEKSVLVISAKNCTEVPLQLHSMSFEFGSDDTNGRRCSIYPGGETTLGLTRLLPAEQFKKIFTVVPEVDSSKLSLGKVSLKWKRDSSKGQAMSDMTKDLVLTEYTLPDVSAEMSPLTVCLDCPPHAILGDPFTYHVRILNQTQLLQEVKFSLGDTQSFVLCGSHNDTVFVLPKSQQILSYKVVPLYSGLQQLPKITVTSVRYSAGFQPSTDAYTVFVFPSQPHFKLADAGNKTMESVAVD